jgi:hypothetical protein
MDALFAVGALLFIVITAAAGALGWGTDSRPPFSDQRQP